MDVKSGYPWWTVRNGILAHYPPLADDARCEVAVVGAGVTGALITTALADAGLDVLVLDRRDVGWGSTAASTALLQYDIDTNLAELCRMIGEDDAVRAYRACEHAVRQVALCAEELGDVGYRAADSVYFASRRGDVGALRDEFEMRKKHGLDVDWFAPGDLADACGFSAPAALRSRPAAVLDPFRFTHALFERLHRRGVRIHDRTTVERCSRAGNALVLRTGRGATVRADWVVIAAGYETQAFLPARAARNRSTYALVTEPVATWPAHLRDCVVWETARPYLYLRSTEEGRLIVGGGDDAIDIPARRDKRIARKTEKLLNRINRMFPGLEWECGFAWAGTFAETADGLPYFGSHPELDERILFAMAYGGNGITFSALGAEIIACAVRGKIHPDGVLFGFSRRR
jgi:glycine/D-amino acid oxidase-like deaminating enzyme